jgi:hypothetical protein
MGTGGGMMFTNVPAPYEEYKTVMLHGKIINGYASFSCGYTVDRKQMEWLVGKQLHEGDKFSFQVVNPQTTTHKHEYKCQCGKVHE